MKIKIHNSTYIILLIAFLAGYFEYMYLFLITIIVHEAGHVIFGYIVNFKYSFITIYPFGGLTIYNEDLNVSSNKELFCLFGGLIFQLLFYFIIIILHNNMFVTNHVFIIIKKINYILLSFNFLPIVPLDGGRIVNIILNKVLSYKLSNKLSIIISFVFTIYFLIKSKTIMSFILFLFLVKCIIVETNYLKEKFNLFLIERYLNDYEFKKQKSVKSINDFKRDYYHYINGLSEKYVLFKMFNSKYNV